MQRTVLLLCLFLFSSASIIAQNALVNSDNNLLASNDKLTEMTGEDWSFYIDEESQTYFIDFESIQVNLSDIILKDQNGTVLFKDDVHDLPVNTIYELDMSAYEADTYIVELRSFTGVIRKEVSIR